MIILQEREQKARDQGLKSFICSNPPFLTLFFVISSLVPREIGEYVDKSMILDMFRLKDKLDDRVDIFKEVIDERNFSRTVIPQTIKESVIRMSYFVFYFSDRHCRHQI